MKKLFSTFLLFFFANLFFSQEVYLRKIVDINKDSKDKVLLAMPQAQSTSKLLGEIEVIGFSENDQNTFKLIYNKAKEIGANTYVLKKFENIDGSLQDLDPSHYKLNLYYTPIQDVKTNPNLIHIISSSKKDQKIRINDRTQSLPSRTYLVKNLSPGEALSLSTRKLLGSSVKYINDETKSPAYFQISGFSLHEDAYGNAGLVLKSGDINKLDQSYGQFLTTIYQEIKN